MKEKKYSYKEILFRQGKKYILIILQVKKQELNHFYKIALKIVQKEIKDLKLIEEKVIWVVVRKISNK